MKHQYWERREQRRARPDRRETALKDLREVREAARKNQVEVAEAMEKDQSEISRIENRDDWLVSTLRDYVRALGGELEVVAIVGGKRLRLRNV
jgi:predicted  nucleic acid-binding Zn-ribbon protein